MSKAPMSPLGQALFSMMREMTRESIRHNDESGKQRVIEEIRRRHQPIVLNAMTRISTKENP